METQLTAKQNDEFNEWILENYYPSTGFGSTTNTYLKRKNNTVYTMDQLYELFKSKT